MTALIAADPRLADIRIRDDLPQGEIHVSRRDGELWIDHADPRVIIGIQLLDAIACGARPEVTIRLRDDARLPHPWQGAVITIRAANRTVIYRLAEYLDWYCGWIAEWPD